MRLSQIKVAGFKSFVDATSLPLPSNLTAVVGPNGCGKSNIIDAVRWVLGESSMKTLRSSSSEDVIFNGSRSRKPVGRASVELTFDNSDQTLQGPYAHYNEVSVRRELTRDGQSQYFLNGSKCLRRDVVDLFLGTGLGARSGYAIIEQGMVSRMIEAKPEELRQWLEEAAGISRYRERRRETESRIRSTRENLSRVNDLHGEVEARAKALERQAENARKYKQYREEESKLKVEIHFLNTRDTEAQCEAAKQQAATCDSAQQRARATLNTSREARLRAEVELESARNAFNAAQSAHYSAEAEYARAEQGLRHARQLADMRDREIASLGSERDKAQQEHQTAVDAAQAAAQREQQLNAQLEQTTTRLKDAQQALSHAEQMVETHGQALQTHDAQSREPLQELAGERARLREREQTLQQLAKRVERLEAELQATPEPDRNNLEAAQTATRQAATALEEARAVAESAEHKAEQCEAARTEAQSTLAEARSAQAQLSSEHASLKTLQAAALGEDDSGLNDWIHGLGLGDAARLGQRLRVEEGWEGAVEHVLGQLLQAPMALNLDTAAAQAGEAPESGAAVVAAADGRRAEGDGLGAKVTAPPAIQALLAGIGCARDSAEAERQLSAHSDAAYSVITPDGVWRARGWLRTPPRGSGGGVIARSRRLEQLDTELAQAAERLQAAEAAAEATSRAQSEAVAARRATAQEAERAREAHARAQSAEQKAQRAFDEQTAKRQRVVEQREEVRKEHVERRTDVESLRATLADLESRAQTLAGERESLAQAEREARQQRDQARNTVSEAQRAESDLQARLAAARSENASAAKRAEEFATRAGQLAETLAARKQQPEQDQAVKEAETLLATTDARQKQTREALAEARRAQETCEQTLATARQEEQKAQAAADEAQAAQQEAQLNYRSLDAQRQTLAARFEEFGVTRSQVAEALEEGAETAAWQERLEKLQRRIERLGAINLAAIDELTETRERAEELATQHKDISDALETLEEAIRKIDRETRSRFRETFDQVNERFAARFPRLFGGGEAALELTDEDLLQAGVRVMARPPGKRNTSIHLLSGGEKAMTAVALLLALFELNPAPFCLLDEVDAPLDDANVSRFCEVIRDMSDSVQFVIITHNKITMALADHLHGVTMAEPGSSRLVSVDVQEAASLAGEAA